MRNCVDLWITRELQRDDHDEQHTNDGSRNPDLEGVTRDHVSVFVESGRWRVVHVWQITADITEDARKTQPLPNRSARVLRWMSWLCVFRVGIDVVK